MIYLVLKAVVKHLSIGLLIIKVRNIMIWTKISVIISHALGNMQTQVGVSGGCVKKVILNVKIRWNSTFYMIERFIEMVNIVSHLTFQYVSLPEMPTSIEMNTLKQFTELLKPLEFVTRESSGKKYITI